MPLRVSGSDPRSAQSPPHSHPRTRTPPPGPPHLPPAGHRVLNGTHGSDCREVAEEEPLWWMGASDSIASN